MNKRYKSGLGKGCLSIFIIVGIALVVGIGPIGTVSAENLVYNGDFEIIDPQDSTNPEGWKIECGGKYYYSKVVASNHYYSGSHSVIITLGPIWDLDCYGVIKSPLIDTVQGNLIWYQSQRTTFDSSDIEYTIEFYDEDDNSISNTLYYTDTTTSQAGPGCGGGPGDSDMSPPAVIADGGGPSPGDHWYKFSMEIPDIGTDKFRFEIHMHAWEAPNKVGDGDACGTQAHGSFDNFNIELSNQPPVADANSPYESNEGDQIIFDAHASYDPDEDSLKYRWDFNNDGIWDTGGSSSPTASHTWNDDWSGTAKLEVSDGELTDTDTASVTVNNVAPTITSLTGPVDPVEDNNAVSVIGDFTDPGLDDTHTATFDWGDTTSTDYALMNGEREVTGTHAYTEAGVYTVTLTVTDDDGGSDSEIFLYVVVYDPDGGFVTGGGWIYSPAGASAQYLDAEGKATFGFVSKYKKGATVPTGNTQFNFNAGNINFHSDNYDWLVIAGHKAMYKGTGTIYDDGHYGFMLSAIDEKLTPSTDVDMFRIRIWDKDNGDAVVYDNNIGNDDDADPTTALGGGTIIIHKVK